MRPLSSHLLRWLLPILWMTMIFVGSSDRLSSAHTSRFVEPLLRWLFHGTLPNERLDEIHFLIRKAGHVCEYAVLCLSFWWALHVPAEDGPIGFARLRWQRAVSAIVLATVYAACDEFHQSFVPTRTASLHDVLIDAAGATLGLSLFLLAVCLARALSNKLRRQAAVQTGAATPPAPPG